MNTYFPFFLVLIAAVAANQRSIYAQQAYEVTDNQKLQEVGDLLKAQPTTTESQQGLVHLLHATLHSNLPPSFLESGQMVNELHPPVKVVVQRLTKARRIPHRDGEVSRRIPAGSVLIALATTPDMLWIQVGKEDFIPTKDARLEEPLNRETPQVRMLTPPLEIHARGDVTVRKIPDVGGKPVAQLRSGELLTATGVTLDYAWLMIGPNQFIPTTSAKMGDPTTPLVPPLTIHMKRDTVVREAPTMQGKPVTVLHRGDIMQAVAVTADTMWLKVAHNNYVRTIDCKLGLPLPPIVDFPQPLVVKLIADAPVVKNPLHPEAVLRTLRKDDEMQVFGATADFKWLMVTHKRFIPMETAQMKEAIPAPIPLEPRVPIKLSTGVEARDIPDVRGRVMLVARKGDKFEADAVSADFTWLRIGNNMWVPMIAAFFRKAPPTTNPLVPPMKVTVMQDTKAYKAPEHTAKVVRMYAEGDVLTANAATPDLAWLQVGSKLFIPASGVKLDDSAATAPLFPPLTVVVTKDVRVLKSPDAKALPVRRLKRGEVLKVSETTLDMKWLKLDANQFVPTEYCAHVAHTSPLSPPVRIVAAAELKVRNAPVFAGMPVKTIAKGEVLEATEVSPDFKWVKIAVDQYVPVSGCVLHESEGKDMLVVLKIRNSYVDKDPIVAAKPTKKPDQQVTTSQAASLFKQAFEKRIKAAEENNNVAPAPEPVVELDKKITQLRITEDTLVMSRPDEKSTPVRGLKKGSLVDASGLGTDLTWLQIGTNEYVRISVTEPTGTTTAK